MIARRPKLIASVLAICTVMGLCGSLASDGPVQAIWLAVGVRPVTSCLRAITGKQSLFKPMRAKVRAGLRYFRYEIACRVTASVPSCSSGLPAHDEVARSERRVGAMEAVILRK
jgi:hypothetical protein